MDHRTTLISNDPRKRIGVASMTMQALESRQPTTDGLIQPHSLRVIAGPCAVESYDQLLATARAVKRAGFGYLRGGAFKPRSSPNSFQGLGSEGLDMLSEVTRELDLGIVTEVLDPYDIDDVMAHAEVLQIGSRNMANFALLKHVGAALKGTTKTVVLKRGFAASVDEWLSAAEYVVRGGCENVVLCERGIRTFETSTRFTLDLSSVLIAKRLAHYPVLVDPSHAAGRADLVVPLSKLAVAADIDGLIIEAHHAPELALCDGAQALPHAALMTLRDTLAPVALAFGRTVI
jgi:3-deoxy-7-phosphoheptulonate synthase